MFSDPLWDATAATVGVAFGIALLVIAAGRIARRLDADDAAVCRCGHSRDQHTHYRAGTDCGSCGRLDCPAFKPARR